MATLSVPRAAAAAGQGRRTALIVAAGAWLLLTVALLALVPDSNTFPERLVWGLAAPVDRFESWVIANRATHWLFVYAIDPLSDFIDALLRGVENLLLALPWTVVVVVTGAVAWKAAGRNVTIFAVAGMIFIGLLGLWDATMETMALMGVSVLIALAIGIPLGILCAHYRTLDAVLRPILDAMQVMPAFVYLIPVVLFFGIARVPSVVATVIYALPPAVRLTALGIRQVQADAVEAAEVFGSTAWQKLRKVQLPLATPTILVGVNQTIMMALGIVVIAAMIGAGGLGEVVLKGLQRQNVGLALEAGLAIVLLAMIFDRISGGLARESRRAVYYIPPKQRTIPRALGLYVYWSTVLLVVLLLLFLDAFPGVQEFPRAWQISIDDPVNNFVRWLRDNLVQVGDLPIGTRPMTEFTLAWVLNPLRGFLLALPWISVVAGAGLLGWQAGGWRLGLLCAAAAYGLGGLNMWGESMDTLSQVLVAVGMVVIVGLPLGILAARSNWFEKALRPVLDFLQTIPPFVYLVPVIMLFAPGRMPGLIASVLYGLPPLTRLTNLGIRQVPATATEAAQAFGSTPGQMLRKVQLPMARPAVLMGLNQSVMMVLSMVIIAGLVGGGALGLEAVNGLARGELGTGLEAGLAIVLLAVVLDRITQAWAKSSDQ